MRYAAALVCALALAACSSDDDATTDAPAATVARPATTTSIAAPQASAADVRACRRVESAMRDAAATITGWANSVSAAGYYEMQQALREPVDAAADDVDDAGLVDPLLGLQHELADERVASREGGSGAPGWFEAANGQLARLSTAAGKVAQRCEAIGVDVADVALPKLGS
jgi:hypothetical protein